ncbi:hypothetical protein Tco_0439287 [Tanacetum coccineum]
MKEVDHLTIHTPPSPHVASFHLKDTYCYYHSCIDDPKKHYGFKPGLLGQSGSLGVDFSNMEMMENEWELESKEVSFLGRGLNSPVRPKEVKNDRIKETHHLEHIIQQPIFQHVTSSHNNGLLESGSLGVDFSNMEMIEDDWELEPKEVYFLGRRLNLPVRPKEVENVRIKETHHLEHIIQQPLFQHVAPSHNDGVYRYYHLHLNLSVGEPSPLSVK